MNQLSLDLARTRGDLGVERAAARADRKLPGWTDRAAEAVREALGFKPNNDPDSIFTIEQLREDIAAHEIELPPPPDFRAWGHVTRRAVKLGYIVRVPGAFAAAVSSNGSPKPLYRKGHNA